MHKISPNDTVYKTIKENPSFQAVMVRVGFTHILKPGMIESVGRFTTLKQGAKMKKIPLSVLKHEALLAGFEWEDNHE